MFNDMNNTTIAPQYIDTGVDTSHHKKELPIYGLPKFLQNYINEITRLYKCPREFVTVAVFSAISTVTGNRVSISDGIYSNSLSLWWVNVARSGSNKTQPVKKVLEAITCIDQKLYSQYLKEMEEWKSASDKDVERPQYKTLVVGDMTEESRHTILNHNPNGVMGYYPEIKGFFDDLERYNRSGAIARVLRLWDNDTIKITRKGDPEPTVIDKPFMNILGDLQPSMLKSTFGSKTFIDSGLTQRFLFCYPEYMEFPNRQRASIDTMVESYLGSYLNSLYNNKFPDSDDSIITDNTITLSTSAECLYSTFYNKIQRIKGLAEDDFVASLYGKMQIQVLRLAGIIHMAKALEQGEHHYFPRVEFETMQYAIECMDYFEDCAYRVFNEIMGDEANNSTDLKTDIDVIKHFATRFKILNISQFAKSIGKSQSYISHVLNDNKNKSRS